MKLGNLIDYCGFPVIFLLFDCILPQNRLVDLHNILKNKVQLEDGVYTKQDRNRPLEKVFT